MPSPPGFDTTGIVQQRSLSNPGTTRLARSGTQAISKKQGDEAYEMEELSARMGLCLLPLSAGLAPRPRRFRWRHSRPLRPPPRAARGLSAQLGEGPQNDPMAIFSATKDADRLYEYRSGRPPEVADR